LQRVATLEAVLGPQATASQYPADVPPRALLRRDISRKLQVPRTLDGILALPAVVPSQYPADIPPRALKRRDIRRNLLALPGLNLPSEFACAVYVQAAITDAVYLRAPLLNKQSGVRHHYLQGEMTDTVYLQGEMSGAAYVRAKIKSDDVYLLGEVC